MKDSYNGNVSVSPDGTHMAVGGWNEMKVSNDGGASWTNKFIEEIWNQESSSSRTPVSVGNDGSKMVVTNHSHAYRSSDGGTTWTELDPTGDIASAPQFWDVAMSGNGETIVITPNDATEVGVYVSADGGDHWTGVNPAGSGVSKPGKKA